MMHHDTVASKKQFKKGMAWQRALPELEVFFTRKINFISRKSLMLRCQRWRCKSSNDFIYAKVNSHKLFQMYISFHIKFTRLAYSWAITCFWWGRKAIQIVKLDLKQFYASLARNTSGTVSSSKYCWLWKLLLKIFISETILLKTVHIIYVCFLNRYLITLVQYIVDMSLSN